MSSVFFALVPAADHAAAAARAAGALRPFAAEVGVGHLHAGLAEEDGDVRGRPAAPRGRCPCPTSRSTSSGSVVNGTRVGAEHPLGRGVVGRELAFQSARSPQDGAREELVGRDGKRVRVDERSAAHADARESRDVRKERHLEEAAAAQRRQPEPPLHVPVRLREVGRGKARALFEDEDAIALLREAQGAHAPAEPGADDHEVGVERTFHAASLRPLRGRIAPGRVLR